MLNTYRGRCFYCKNFVFELEGSIRVCSDDKKHIVCDDCVIKKILNKSLVEAMISTAIAENAKN